MRTGRLLAAAAAVTLLAACASSGSSPVSSATPTANAPASASATPGSTSASSTPSSTTASASAAASPTSVVTAADLAGAGAAALGPYEKAYNNVNDPSAGYFWTSVPLSRSPMSTALRARLQALTRAGWFDDRRCGEDYVTGTQWGLPARPTVVSATPGARGTVVVVLARQARAPHRLLTVTEAKVGGRWVAVDLASGTGPSASIFAAHPSC